MAKLSELEFLKKVIELLKESLTQTYAEAPREIVKIGSFIQGRIDSLDE